MLPRNIFIQKKSPKCVSIKVVLKICSFAEITLLWIWCIISDDFSIVAPLGTVFVFIALCRWRFLVTICSTKKGMPETVCSKDVTAKHMQYQHLIDIHPNMRKVSSPQTFRANADLNASFQYCLGNVCFPLPDHLIQRTDNRFDKCGSTVYFTYGFILSIIIERDVTVKYNTAVSIWSIIYSITRSLNVVSMKGVSFYLLKFVKTLIFHDSFQPKIIFKNLSNQESFQPTNHLDSWRWLVGEHHRNIKVLINFSK